MSVKINYIASMLLAAGIALPSANVFAADPQSWTMLVIIRNSEDKNGLAVANYTTQNACKMAATGIRKVLIDEEYLTDLNIITHCIDSSGKAK